MKRDRKQAVLITVYKDYEQVKRLIEKLSGCYIYVHVDKKSKQLFCDLTNEYKGEEHVIVVSKFKVTWGSYNHLQAVMCLMKLAIQNSSVKYVHVISGQDYPIVDEERFAEFDNCEKVFMTCKCLNETDDGVASRYDLLHPFASLLDIRSKHYKRVDKRFRCHRARIGRFKVGDLFKGMIWASMPMTVCKYVCEFVNTISGRLFHFGLRFSEIPEEVFFQTILMHSKYRDFVVKDNLRFTLWQVKNGSFPGVLDESDYEAIRNSNAVFARKIDSVYSLNLIERIDNVR